MKTAPFMIVFLPRFRWFVWGFGLCAVMFSIIDEYFSPAIFIFFVLGVFTYLPESVNRRLIENQRQIEALGGKR